MSSLNRVQLIGNLTKDVDFRHTPSGVAVASFGVATSEKYKDKNTGDVKENTEFHNVVLWNKLAEIANEYAGKGKKVFIEGKLKTERYEQDGVTKYATKIIGTSLILLSPKGDSQGRQQAGGDHSYEEPPFDPSDDIPF